MYISTNIYLELYEGKVTKGEGNYFMAKTKMEREVEQGLFLRDTEEPRNVVEKQYYIHHIVKLFKKSK